METLYKREVIFWEYDDELKKLEDIIIWIRTTIKPNQSEEIFKSYNEIKYHNFGDSKINYSLCFNKISLIINELNIIWIDNNSMENFHRFKCYISWNMTKEEIDNVSSKINNIIFL